MIMIKSNKGRVELEGTPFMMLTELGMITNAVYKALVDVGFKEEFAKERIKGAYIAAFSTYTAEEEKKTDKDLDKKIDEKLDKLANAIFKELFEGGSNDGE